MNYKKHILVTTAIAICFIAVGCNKIIPPELTAELGQQFELSKGQKATIENADLTITFKKLVEPGKNFGSGVGLGIGPRPDYYIIEINKIKYELPSSLEKMNKHGEYRPFVDREKSTADKVTMVIYKANECNNINNNTARANCLIEKQDPFACLSIDDKENRGRCIMDQIDSPEISKINTEGEIKRLCNGVDYTTKKEYCIRSVYQTKAKLLNKPDYCLNLTTEQERAWCLQEVAIANKDGKICERITNATVAETRDDCYYKIDELLQNKILCDRIVGEWKRKDCFERTWYPINE